ncbi:MAG: hypothetical protein QOF78_3282 [Phycisphaerales bacterium]|jgi:hypothetical protein|nr:hypothetical protein [Phycisphaerales bacterium]
MASPIRFAATAVRAESKPTMNKRQLIDEIRQFNTSVRPQFLSQFDEEALRQYLTSLQSAQRKHLKIPAWIRQQPKLKMVS